VIQTAFIGDAVLVEPLVAQLKESLPEARIDILVRPQAAELFETHPAVHAVLVYDKRGRDRGLSGFRRILTRLRSQGYDLILVPHRSIRSALLARLSRSSCRIGFETSTGKWLFSIRVPYEPVHEVIRNLKLLTPLGLDAGYRNPKIYPTTEEYERVTPILQGSKAVVRVALAPGSIWATKRWPETSYIELARQIKREIDAAFFILGSREDRALGETLARSIGADAVNLCGRLTLRESVALLSQCDVLISNDSAPTHLGVAAGCRVVTIFGPTVPAFGFYPFGSEHRVVEPEVHLSCRPCGIHGGRKCPIGTHECMLSIRPERVAALILNMVNEEAARQSAIVQQE